MVRQVGQTRRLKRGIVRQTWETIPQCTKGRSQKEGSGRIRAADRHILDACCRPCTYFLGKILPLLPTPKATHPAIKHNPPRGVIGPAILPKR